MDGQKKPVLGALFPGQGSQWVGMAKELRDNFSWTREVFEEASDAIKIDLLQLCLEGPSDDLQRTMNAQPAILTTSFAWFQVLRRKLDISPIAAAGHSLGEYSALLASGAISLSEAVRLVRKRGELMQTAVPQGRGKMSAVLGLSDDAVKELCRLASEGPQSLVVPANFNAPNQVVIAGHTAAVERAETIASDGKNPELKAKKVVALKVSAPFHCPLMKPVAEVFVRHLEAVRWHSRKIGIAHNLDAVFRREGDLIPLLRDQVDNPVLWTACQRTLESQGVTHYIELGPGKVLTGLGKRIVDQGQFFPIDSVNDVKNFETIYEGVFQ